MSRLVKIGNLKIGAGNPIRVQSMLKSNIGEKRAIKEFKELKNNGAEIIRVAVKNLNEVRYLRRFLNKNVPVVSDVHFDYRIAVESIKAGVDKIRINPSNIGEKWKVSEVVKHAKEKNIPIRIGANIGSLKKKYKDEEKRAVSLVEEIEKELDVLEKYRFREIVVSMKAEDISTTYLANKMFSKKYDYPIHIGLTATGDRFSGMIKSSILIGILLKENIGDTLRVSLTSTSLEEVCLGWEILFALNLRKPNYEIISCPGCGRTDFKNLLKSVEYLKKKLPLKKESRGKTLKIAFMGCEVNGPGEARSADFGFVLGKNGYAYFEKGRVKKKVGIKELKKIIDRKIKF